MDNNTPLLDLILLNFLPPAARTTIFLMIAFCCWVFIGWYYPIEHIKDPQQKSKTMYYILLCICGILPIILMIIGVARSNSSNNAIPAAPPAPPTNVGGIGSNASRGLGGRQSAPY